MSVYITDNCYLDTIEMKNSLERGADGKIFIEKDCKITFTNKTYSEYAITIFCLVVSCKLFF